MMKKLINIAEILKIYYIYHKIHKIKNNKIINMYIKINK